MPADGSAPTATAPDLLPALERGDGVARCRWSKGCPRTDIRCRGLCPTHYPMAREKGVLEDEGLPPQDSSAAGRKGALVTAEKRRQAPDPDGVRMIPRAELVDRALRSLAGEPVEPLSVLAALPRSAQVEGEAPAARARLVAPSAPVRTNADRAADLRHRMRALDALDALPTNLSDAARVQVLDDNGNPVAAFARTDADHDADTWSAIEQAIADVLAQRRAELEVMAFGGMP